MKKKRLFHKLFADYFLLNMVLIINLVHLAIMIVYTVWNRMDYEYFAFHFNTQGGFWELLWFLLRFLMPSVLAVLSAMAYRLIDKKPKIWRKLVRLVSVLLLSAAAIQSLILTFIFEPSMPIASYTEDPANIFQYDLMVRQNMPSSNCPDLTREIPEHAEDVEFSYWYIDIMDYEWRVNVAYTLPAAEYEALRDDALSLLQEIEGMTVTESDGWVTWDTVEYREDLGRSYTRLVCGFHDDECRITYTWDCFRFEGYVPGKLGDAVYG